ncbi:hypothetical protein BY996DRAFT_8690199 [Phakopsora pachyrhizi]|nr:hypothetical protein BY996DRAFT_8690199 [Phakopsora pachyrhizi]
MLILFDLHKVPCNCPPQSKGNAQSRNAPHQSTHKDTPVKEPWQLVKIKFRRYTEVQDLGNLLPILDNHTTPKFELILAVDRAIGYYPFNKPRFSASTSGDSKERWIDYLELYQQHQNKCWGNEAQMIFGWETEKSILVDIQKNQSDRSP